MERFVTYKSKNQTSLLFSRNRCTLVMTVFKSYLMKSDPLARISLHSFINTLSKRILCQRIIRNSPRIPSTQQTQTHRHFAAITDSLQLNILRVVYHFCWYILGGSTLLPAVLACGWSNKKMTTGVNINCVDSKLLLKFVVSTRRRSTDYIVNVSHFHNN